MKQGIHADNYRLVVFEDLNNGTRFLTKSTVKTSETTKWEDNQEYPFVKVHITSASHPFYTGQEKLVDVEGRVDKFKARQIAASKAQEDRKSKPSTSSVKPAKADKEDNKTHRITNLKTSK